MAKADDGRKEVDKELAELEKKIEKEYKKATKDLEEKLNKYLSAFEEQDKKQKKLVDDGKLTEEQYKQWRLGKILSSNRWKDMRDKLADELTKVDKTAVGMINDFMPDAYAMGRNYGTYEVEKASKINTSFTLYDKDTVKGLIRNDPDLLPKPKVDIPADKRWNKEHINSSITQGILQGESVGKISKRLQDVTDMDRDSAIRNARTMTSAAENAGRVDSYKRAENMGIKMMQVWGATLDSRTREAHRELDGQERPVGEPFQNSIGKILYPGDPHADPSNVYNCRCTIIAKVKSSRINASDMTSRNSKLGAMSYDEWKKNHKAEEAVAPKPKTPDFKSDKVKAVLGEDNYKEFAEKVNNAETKDLFNKYAEQGKYTYTTNGGSYSKWSSEVRFGYSDKHVGRDKYGTLAHEMGHMIDYKSAADVNLSFTEINGVEKIINWSIDHRPSQSDEFLAAIRSDAKRLESIYSTDVVKDLLSSTESSNVSNGVQDFIDGMFNTQDRGILPWGHGGKYFNRFYNNNINSWTGRDKDLKNYYNSLGLDASNLTKTKNISRTYETASEAWANITAALTVGGKELEVVEKYMPDSVEAYRKIAEGLTKQ